MIANADVGARNGHTGHDLRIDLRNYNAGRKYACRGEEDGRGAVDIDRPY